MKIGDPGLALPRAVPGQGHAPRRETGGTACVTHALGPDFNTGVDTPANKTSLPPDWLGREKAKTKPHGFKKADPF